MEATEVGLEWRDVPSIKYLQASRCGKIRSMDRVMPSKSRWVRKGRVLRDFNNGNGYRYFTLSYPVRANYYVHRIVAETWCDNPHQYNEINHKDFNRKNNHSDNLEWVSRAQNMQHNMNHDRVSHGEKSGTNKIKLSQVHEILEALITDPFLNRSELGRRYGLADHAVLRISKGQRWRRHVSEWCGNRGISLSEFTERVNPGISALKSKRGKESYLDGTNPFVNINKR